MVWSWRDIILKDGHLLPLDYLSIGFNLLRSAFRSVKIWLLKIQAMDHTVVLYRRLCPARWLRDINLRTYSLTGKEVLMFLIPQHCLII
jgi:hypothetical protein